MNIFCYRQHWKKTICQRRRSKLCVHFSSPSNSEQSCAMNVFMARKIVNVTATLNDKPYVGGLQFCVRYNNEQLAQKRRIVACTKHRGGRVAPNHFIRGTADDQCLYKSSPYGDSIFLYGKNKQITFTCSTEERKPFSRLNTRQHVYLLVRTLDAPRAARAFRIISVNEHSLHTRSSTNKR